MNSRLEQIEHWPDVAPTVAYQASGLAAHFKVCERQLERAFRVKLGASPHKCLRALRMKRALQLLREQPQIKQVALELGYKYPEHFARDFKNYFGVPPREHRSVVFPPPPKPSLLLAMLCIIISHVDELPLFQIELLMS
jgi:transcriptional regulator GlxA family with amidase domain